MAIDYSQLRSLTAREVITALIRDGFFLRSQVGSHQRYRHPDGRRVPVSFHHPRDTFPFKTLLPLHPGLIVSPPIPAALLLP